jgi:glycosyltransferase involved in cell wall biosynthesis
MTPDAKPRLSVIMPVHNEARTLREIVGKVLAATGHADIELVIVDDGSTDDSRAIIAELAGGHPNIRHEFQNPNQGKGAAVRKGFALAAGDWVLIQDADLEYDPADYDRLLAPALAGGVDAVYGSRFAPSAECRRVRRFWHTLGNRALTALSNLLNGLRLTDMETCYKLIRADLAKRLRLRSRSFTIEPEITARLAQAGARIVEVPISYRGRTYAEGKNIGPWDAVEAVATMVYCRFSRSE